MLRAVRVSLLPADCHRLTTLHVVHRWLYIYAGILHRDLSPNNIMCRFMMEADGEGKEERKVHGVLADYDLSSLVENMKLDYTRTSQQRTGTPPYMAHELLLESSPIHLYRHDLESLFYIMLLMAARHTIRTPAGEAKPRVAMRESRRLPYQDWFDEPRYNMLGLCKWGLFSKTQSIEVSPDFEDFFPWLVDLQQCFENGFKLQPSPNNTLVQLAWRPAVQQPAEFDDETLGGFITYANILAAVPYLSGKLKGLIVRDPGYPSAPASSTSAGTVQVDG